MFGSDGSPVVQYVSIFAVIFAVLTVIVLVVRRLGGGGLADAKRGAQRGRQPRLGIVDVYELDRQRQLILLRRDNVEHLLLVGGPNDVVIERHIQRGQQRDPGARPEAMAEPRADAATDAFPGLETRVAATLRPDFTMPIVLPPAPPDAGTGIPRSPPFDAALFEAAEPGPERAVEAIVPGPRPEVSGRRPMRRTAPPLINPRPDVASERARAEPAPEEPDFAMTPIPPAERRSVDPAILSDMARQLEAALARPASAVTPSPARPAPPAPAPVPEAPTAIDPMAAAMAAPADAPNGPEEASDGSRVEVEPPPPAQPAPEPEPFLPAPPLVAPAPPPPPPPPAPPPELPPAPVVEAAPPAPPTVEPTPPTAKPAANPFSVEEIEAEFARLLGRPLEKRN